MEDIPLCIRCGLKPRILRPKSYHPSEKYYSYCRSCKRRTYRWHKKDRCEHCGFVAIHKAQLDVDHIDGNHRNNDPSNLQTLCANCHRLKTILNKDYLPSPVED